MDGRSHHAVLGVDECASPDEIKRAYRLRALAAHPDQGGRREDFEAVVAAFRALRSRRPNPFTRVATAPTSTWSLYDGVRRPPRVRRPDFAEILAAELARAG
jgi:hypothetical protein